MSKPFLLGLSGILLSFGITYLIVQRSHNVQRLAVGASSKPVADPGDAERRERETTAAISPDAEKGAPFIAPQAEPPFCFKTSPSLKIQLIEELSVQYRGRAPDLLPALQERRSETGPLLLEISANQQLTAHARSRAVRLAERLEVPGFIDVVRQIALGEAPPPGAIECLGRIGQPKDAESLIRVFGTNPGKVPEEVVSALVQLGNPLGISLIDRAAAEAQEFWQEKREIAAREPEHFNSGGFDRAWMEDLARFEFYRRALESDGSAEATLPYLFNEKDYAREWALQRLCRLEGPNLVASLRSGLDFQKGRKPHRRSFEAGYEYALMWNLKRVGGTLTPDEERFLQEAKSPGCIAPTLAK